MYNTQSSQPLPSGSPASVQPPNSGRPEGSRLDAAFTPRNLLPEVGRRITVQEITFCPSPMSPVIMIASDDTIFYIMRVLDMSLPSGSPASDQPPKSGRPDGSRLDAAFNPRNLLPKIGDGITVEKIIVCPFPMSTVLMITYADTSEGRIYYTTRVLEMSRPLATGPLMTSVSSVYSDVTGLVRDTGPVVAKPPPPHLQRRIESQTASTSVDQGQGSALPPFDRPAAPSSDGETTSASFQPPAVSTQGSGTWKYVEVPGNRYLQPVQADQVAPKALPSSAVAPAPEPNTGTASSSAAPPSSWPPNEWQANEWWTRGSR